MKRVLLTGALTCAACMGRMPAGTDGGGGNPNPETPDATVQMAPDADPSSPWRLVWEDDFLGGAGQEPSAERWTAELGGSGWGNEELQYYTDRASNVSVDGNGNLAITARREEFGGRAYTSGRIITANKFERAYGRFEARIRLPRGQGVWPAFWLLGNDFAQVSWPECGEIDILEQRGQQPAIVHGTLHGPGYSGADGLSSSHAITSEDPTESFHVYAVVWRPGRITWFVDDVQYHERTTGSIPEWGRWVYDHPFFIILNVAVGGHFVGPPNAETPLPQTMLVDYVRVFELVQ